MEIIVRPKAYTYEDIKNKRKGNAWILLKIACILYSNKEEHIKSFTLSLLSYLYKFKTITEAQVNALSNIYIEETILLENIHLNVQALMKLTNYNVFVPLNTLNTSLPKLISTVSNISYVDKGENKLITTELATEAEFNFKLNTILYNLGTIYSVANRNTAFKVMKDYHLLTYYTRHMKHVIDCIIPKGQRIKYKPLPTNKSLLDAYMLVYN